MSSDQCVPTRTHISYDPFAEISDLGWRVQLARLADGATEQYDLAAQIVYMDPDALAEDVRHGLAHAASHIRHDLGPGGCMSALQEANANSDAYLWLDREWK